MLNASQCVVSIALFSCICGLSNAHATPILDPNLRIRLAQIYAPEIRQDRQERFGLSSPGYFLHHSDLYASVRRCLRHGKKQHRVKLGPSSLLLLHNQLHFTRYPKCRRTYSLFQSSRTKANGNVLLPAHGQLYMQLVDKTPKTLLSGKFRHHAIPEVTFHTYARQHFKCIRRNWLRVCKENVMQRYYIIQFFVHLMFNEACNEHEGEHEGMVLLIDASVFDAARDASDYRKAIRKVGYYAHYKTKIFSPKAVTFVDSTHPVAFMGAGGHGLYPRRGTENLSGGFPFEMRPWLKRICRTRGRAKRLYEHHRGGGPTYRAWNARPFVTPHRAMMTLPARGPLWFSAFPWKLTHAPTKAPEPLSFGVIRADNKHLEEAEKYLSQSLPLNDVCLLSKSSRGVRLCDVQMNKLTDPCCFRRTVDGFVRWIQFTGRWGKQEKFASGLTGTLAAGLGRVMKRWPLGRSLGNSGPFGPKFIHQSTWNWYPVDRTPPATPSTWR